MKGRLPKKMSAEEADAQMALDSACIRGYSQEVIEQLRKNLETVRSKKKKVIGEAVPVHDVPPPLKSSTLYPATKPIKIPPMFRIEK